MYWAWGSPSVVPPLDSAHLHSQTTHCPSYSFPDVSRPCCPILNSSSFYRPTWTLIFDSWIAVLFVCLLVCGLLRVLLCSPAKPGIHYGGRASLELAGILLSPAFQALRPHVQPPGPGLHPSLDCSFLGLFYNACFLISTLKHSWSM